MFYKVNIFNIIILKFVLKSKRNKTYLNLDLIIITFIRYKARIGRIIMALDIMYVIRKKD